MSKRGRKKYVQTNIRQMAMATVGSQPARCVTDSVVESRSAHLQTRAGRTAVPAVAQVATITETDESADSEGVIDSHKHREILSQRPSYRRILNELSSDVPGVPKIGEEKSEEGGSPPGITTMAVPTSIYQTSTGQYIAIAQGGAVQLSNPGSEGVQGLQALTMTNSGAPPPSAALVHYAAQAADGKQQFFVPGSQVVVQDEETELDPSHMAVATGDMPAYQIRAPATALPQGVVMAASPGSLHGPQQLAEEATRKRELRLMKNRYLWFKNDEFQKQSVFHSAML
ncbi:cAMP-responsive element modulator isoform X7 [Heterocephalus glaber]|uniref:cAMP-responsive element modulator n=1 Tax=Heterocephalus glaber TaxID=10181 RepID=A0AAX6PYG3_HETGA|nr:cAMP-responsive element modulator isoform X7 [Heterocephalus glaber]